MMLIGDGVTPGNEGRGYVLRRLLRRAVRSMRLLGFEDPALPELLPVSRDKMAETYTELHRDWERISTVAYAEEDAFRQTLRGGHPDLRPGGHRGEAAGGTQLSGDGPSRCTTPTASRSTSPSRWPPSRASRSTRSASGGLMTEQRERAKADAKAKKGAAPRRHGVPRGRRHAGPPVEFTGYSEVVSEGAVRGHRSTAGGVVDAAREGDEVELVLDRTPFYAEGGGQLADQGVIELENGARLEVTDVQSPITGLIVHKATRAQRRGHRRRPARRRWSTSSAALSISRAAHRDAHGAQGVPRGARRDRDPGRLGERPGPVPLRLLRDRRGARRR